MDECLDYVFLVSAHDCATDPSIVCLWPEVPRVRGVATVLQRNQVVLLIACWVVGVRRTSRSIDLARVWIDKLRPRLL